MEFKTTLEIVTKDIQDIEKLVGNFKNYSRIPNIELDLALARLRNVYELLLMFRNDLQTTIEQPESEPVKNIAVAGNEINQVDSTVSAIMETIDSDVTITADSVSVPPAIEEPVKTTVKPVIEKKPDEVSKPEQLVKQEIKNKTEEQKIFIHEKLGAHTNKKDITSKLQNQSIKSISGSLGINDKFLFIRELFAGNAETFRQTMDELDDARNFNDAYSLLMEKFHWDMDSEPVQLLLNLIRRKFIPSGNE